MIFKSKTNFQVGIGLQSKSFRSECKEKGCTNKRVQGSSKCSVHAKPKGV